ncbi:MAG: tRNA (adenosine(37)-N6)-dimethylallyltransferase MiaA [Bacteroidota bacterium]|nr:tRNA (adenosine(37)-N6)-dimethylallyltransferase MiaA [Bacteroidota bacterium]
MKPLVLVIAGPTASGKTEVGILCASALGGEIISADSRQVYRGFDIGSAKPSPEWRAIVPHYFIDCADAEESYTAGRFAREAAARILEIAARGKRPIVVGGSGLYIRALMDGLFDDSVFDIKTERERLRVELAARGAAVLYAELARCDPAAAASISPANVPRILRALEVCRATGMPYSVVRQERMVEVPFEGWYCGIRWPRPELYARIERRVDEMFRRGLVEEVRALLERGTDPNARAFNGVGYREVAAYLHGSLTRDEAVRLVKQHSRNYAKRQMTWFAKDTRIRWYEARNADDLPRIASRIEEDYLAEETRREASH